MATNPGGPNMCSISAHYPEPIEFINPFIYNYIIIATRASGASSKGV
jgi:hypothetical protein